MKLNKMTVKIGALVGGVAMALAAVSMQPTKTEASPCYPWMDCHILRVAKPDLVTTVSAKRAPNAANTLEVKVTVKNVGNAVAPAGSSTIVSVQKVGAAGADGTFYTEGAIAAGGSVTHVFYTPMVGNEGFYKFTGHADAFGNVAVESNEGNNITTITASF